MLVPWTVLRARSYRHERAAIKGQIQEGHFTLVQPTGTASQSRRKRNEAQIPPIHSASLHRIATSCVHAARARTRHARPPLPPEASSIAAPPAGGCWCRPTSVLRSPAPATRLAPRGARRRFGWEKGGDWEEEEGDRGVVAMLQLLMALAFSAAPLTLYVPPVRSLSLFVEAMEAVCRDCAPYSHGAVMRFRLGLSRILAGLARALR
ncbi:hypothetical protein ACP4OV_015773 [Aristida adscensionis]